jgi:hypothetical protein
VRTDQADPALELGRPGLGQRLQQPGLQQFPIHVPVAVTSSPRLLR